MRILECFRCLCFFFILKSFFANSSKQQTRGLFLSSFQIKIYLIPKSLSILAVHFPPLSLLSFLASILAIASSILFTLFLANFYRFTMKTWHDEIWYSNNPKVSPQLSWFHSFQWLIFNNWLNTKFFSWLIVWFLFLALWHPFDLFFLLRLIRELSWAQNLDISITFGCQYWFFRNEFIFHNIIEEAIIFIILIITSINFWLYTFKNSLKNILYDSISFALLLRG